MDEKEIIELMQGEWVHTANVYTLEINNNIISSKALGELEKGRFSLQLDSKHKRWLLIAKRISCIQPYSTFLETITKDNLSWYIELPTHNIYFHFKKKK